MTEYTKLYKVTVRVPCAEPYAYIELELEDTPELILEAYRAFSVLVKEGPGLDSKTFNEVLDRYVYGNGTMDPEMYEGMHAWQRDTIQTIKRSKARIKSRAA